MSFDERVPSALKERQIWFAGIITRPIDENSHMMPLAPNGAPMTSEACRYISPSPTMQPHKRIELYNQQYWWRLLKAMHEIAPLVTRLFGYADFNQSISTPYLIAYPPNSWSLNVIGDQLLKWIDDEYHADDKKLVRDSAMLDLAFNYCFLAPSHRHLSTENESTSAIAQLMTQTLFHQPHVKLFQLDCDMFTFRSEFLKHDPDYWIDNDFPKLMRERTYFFVMARNNQNHIIWKEVPEEEFRFLERFSNGCTIEDACEWLETQPAAMKGAAETYLAHWLQDWTLRRWLTPVRP